MLNAKLSTQSRAVVLNNLGEVVGILWLLLLIDFYYSVPNAGVDFFLRPVLLYTRRVSIDLTINTAKYY